jgi:hypothetical protein
MRVEDKFAFIAKKDRALADSIIKRSEDMEPAALEAVINLEYNYLVEVAVQNEKYDMGSIMQRFMQASESQNKTS